MLQEIIPQLQCTKQHGTSQIDQAFQQPQEYQSSPEPRQPDMIAR